MLDAFQHSDHTLFQIEEWTPPVKVEVVLALSDTVNVGTILPGTVHLGTVLLDTVLPGIVRLLGAAQCSVLLGPACLSMSTSPGGWRSDGNAASGSPSVGDGLESSETTRSRCPLATLSGSVSIACGCPCVEVDGTAFIACGRLWSSAIVNFLFLSSVGIHAYDVVEEDSTLFPSVSKVPRL